jgi:lactoylglutathione lyase
MMEIKFAHINIIARDWKKLAEFYTEVFNCKLKPLERNLSGKWLNNLTGLASPHIKGIHLLMPGFDKDGPTIEIFEYNSEVKNENKVINKEGFSHIAFSVQDVEACLNLLINKGGSTVGELVNTEIENAGKINVVYAKDPEGNIIEIQKWE